MKKSNFAKIRAMLFYTAYAIFILHYILKSITFFDNDVNTILYAVGAIILGFLGLVNVIENGIKNSLVIIVATVALFGLFLVTHDLLLPTIWMLIVSAKGCNFDKLVKFDVLIKIVLVSLVVLLSVFGILDINSIHTRGEAMRLSLGFYNPNVFSSYVLSIIMDFLYLRRKKYGILELAASAVAIATILLTTGSRTQVGCIALVNLLLLINKKSPKVIFNKVSSWICTHLFTILTVVSLSVLLVYLFIPGTRGTINSAFPDRIRMPANVVKTTGVWLVGNDAYIEYSSDTPLDNLPIYITIVYGVIPMIAVCFAMKRYMKQLNKNTKWVLYVIMATYLASCISEKLCFRPQYNVFLLYASTYLYSETAVFVSWVKEKKNALQQKYGEEE